LELELRGIPFAHQPEISVSYKGRVVGEGRLDLLVANAVIVELKAVEAIAPVHISQVLSYLKATSYPLGLLINFNVKTLKQGITRLVL
jgi:GxxExxY protein